MRSDRTRCEMMGGGCCKGGWIGETCWEGRLEIIIINQFILLLFQEEIPCSKVLAIITPGLEN